MARHLRDDHDLPGHCDSNKTSLRLSLREPRGAVGDSPTPGIAGDGCAAGPEVVLAANSLVQLGAHPQEAKNPTEARADQVPPALASATATGAARGRAYLCAKCGEPKKGHTCVYKRLVSESHAGLLQSAPAALLPALGQAAFQLAEGSSLSAKRTRGEEASRPDGVLSSAGEIGGADAPAKKMRGGCPHGRQRSQCKACGVRVLQPAACS